MPSHPGKTVRTVRQRIRTEKKVKKFIQGAIKRPGALTKAVGGKPSKKLGKVRALAKKGNTLKARQARFFLNVLRPASKRRKK